MVSLVLSVLCSAALGIVFKNFNRFDINVLQAVVVNYFTAVCVAWLALGAFPLTRETVTLQGFEWAMLVGASFIGGFVAVGIATQRIGMATTAVLQKMSLIAPVILGVLLYGESLSIWKILGVVAAIVSIFLTTSSADSEAKGFSLNLPVIAWVVFVMAILADVTLMLLDKNAPQTAKDPRLVATIFATAGACGIFVILYSISKGMQLAWKNVLAGIALGIPNYGSIYFLLKALSSGMESSAVFPMANVGVIVCSTLIAFTVFREKLSLKNWLGIGLALLAIVLVAL
jgi:drug/metabolite transporter (DMT)-like permease